MSSLVWIHEDALRADHPAVTAAEDDAMVCYIWDDDYLKKMDYGFKRLVFIYESLCQLPVRIFHGDTTETLMQLVKQQDIQHLYVPSTPNPELQKIAARLSNTVEVIAVADVPFVALNTEPDSKRFFRYWNKSKKQAMQPGGGRESHTASTH